MDPHQNIYQQIAQMIENDILAGRLKSGEQAPSTTQFARQYHINPATALKGINLLVDEHILYKKRGMGMFVTEEAHDIIVKKHKKEFQRTLLPRFLEEARRLGLDADALIALIREEEKGKEAR